MVGARPPEQCGRCRGFGWIWKLLPNGDWKVDGKCPECGGTGKASKPPKGDDAT
jgi:DnaJ-class molecular chaperone